MEKLLWYWGQVALPPHVPMSLRLASWLSRARRVHGFYAVPGTTETVSKHLRHTEAVNMDPTVAALLPSFGFGGRAVCSCAICPAGSRSDSLRVSCAACQAHVSGGQVMSATLPCLASATGGHGASRDPGLKLTCSARGLSAFTVTAT